MKVEVNFKQKFDETRQKYSEEIKNEIKDLDSKLSSRKKFELQKIESVPNVLLDKIQRKTLMKMRE